MDHLSVQNYYYCLNIDLVYLMSSVAWILSLKYKTIDCVIQMPTSYKLNHWQENLSSASTPRDESI